jgi:hypothetical protein
MADTPVPEWKTPTYAQFLAANPHLLNHSSRIVVDPEVPVAVNPTVASGDSSPNPPD